MTASIRFFHFFHSFFFLFMVLGSTVFSSMLWGNEQDIYSSFASSYFNDPGHVEIPIEGHAAQNSIDDEKEKEEERGFFVDSVPFEHEKKEEGKGTKEEEAPVLTFSEGEKKPLQKEVKEEKKEKEQKQGIKDHIFKIGLPESQGVLEVTLSKKNHYSFRFCDSLNEEKCRLVGNSEYYLEKELERIQNYYFKLSLFVLGADVLTLGTGVIVGALYYASSQRRLREMISTDILKTINEKKKQQAEDRKEQGTIISINSIQDKKKARQEEAIRRWVCAAGIKLDKIKRKDVSEGQISREQTSSAVTEVVFADLSNEEEKKIQEAARKEFFENETFTSKMKNIVDFFNNHDPFVKTAIGGLAVFLAAKSKELYYLANPLEHFHKYHLLKTIRSQRNYHNYTGWTVERVDQLLRRVTYMN